MRRPNRVVIDSTETLRKNAKPITELRRNSQAHTLMLDEGTVHLLGGLIARGVVDHSKVIQMTDLKTGLVIALDKHGEFCGVYDPCNHQ